MYNQKRETQPNSKSDCVSSLYRGFYRQRRVLENETRQLVEDRRVAPPNCRGNVAIAAFLRQYLGPRSLVLPQKRNNSRVPAAIWWGHASIFDTWPRLVFWNLLLPINKAGFGRNASSFGFRLGSIFQCSVVQVFFFFSFIFLFSFRSMYQG